MGYLISGLIVRKPPTEAELRSALPKSIAFRIYEQPELGFYAVEGFRPSRPSDYPLSTAIPATDIPLELGPHLSELSAAYETARAMGEANGIKRAYVNLAESVSVSIGTPVLALFTDDDGVDFACIAEAGHATSVWAQCGSKRLKLTGSKTDWQEIAEPVLHQNAAEAFRDFTGADPALFGLGLWDPPDAYGLVRGGT
jgi:hypothetical protein